MVLMNLSNGSSRTNIGIYNPNLIPVTATIRLFEGASLLGTLPVNLNARSAIQLSNIYKTVGAQDVVTTNGYCTVQSDNPGSPLFTYAATADNMTQDPILIVGAEDTSPPVQPTGAATATARPSPPTSTATRTMAGATPTFTRTATPSPTVPAATPTRTPTSGAVQTVIISVKAWDFNPGGPISSQLVLNVGTTYRLVFRNADSAGTTNPRHGFSGISELGLPGYDNIARGAADYVISDFTPQDFQRNIYPFSCTQTSCGGDPQQHSGMVAILRIQ
jgi:hypothetical protein